MPGKYNEIMDLIFNSKLTTEELMMLSEQIALLFHEKVSGQCICLIENEEDPETGEVIRSHCRLCGAEY